ncbi:MAG TPA: endonuclease/exonuclease/phosphatase family protein, partial [Thermomicrobiales bacterium]|nr:endonuclease/exonuclease/phosphatase family protein [Thermomicrobiales bacterium]
ELVRLDADVVALQEVRSRLADDHNHPSDAATFLQRRTAYGFMAFRPYPGNAAEGLASLSEHPLRVVGAGSGTIEDCALRVTVDIDRVSQALTNVHLDWRRADPGAADRRDRQRANARLRRRPVRNPAR